MQSVLLFSSVAANERKCENHIWLWFTFVMPIHQYKRKWWKKSLGVNVREKNSTVDEERCLQQCSPLYPLPPPPPICMIICALHLFTILHSSFFCLDRAITGNQKITINQSLLLPPFISQFQWWMKKYKQLWVQRLSEIFQSITNSIEVKQIITKTLLM